MNHETDYDRDRDREDALTTEKLKEVLMQTQAKENELMKMYLMAAERIHDNDELKARLENFSEGNAKRSQQLSDELKNIH